MIHTMLCHQDHRAVEQVDLAALTHLLANDSAILWLDLDTPTVEELALLERQFGFHPLALEDAAKQHQRPKIDAYDDFYFMVFYDIDYREEQNLIDEHELDIFVGRNYLVTVHYEPIEEIAEVAERFRRNVRQIDRGIGVLLYSLLDTIVDHYFPVIDQIGDRIEEMETRVFGGFEQAALQDIFALKRELLSLRRVIAPERDAMAVLARRDLPIVSEAVAVYFQDIYEHVLRVADALDIYRDLLTGVLDSYLSMNANNLAVASNNLNQVMKTLTSYSIILMSVTIVASIYGMNFDNMPELHTPYGYFAALAGMLVLGLILNRYFKRKGWL